MYVAVKRGHRTPWSCELNFESLCKSSVFSELLSQHTFWGPGGWGTPFPVVLESKARILTSVL